MLTQHLRRVTIALLLILSCTGAASRTTKLTHDVFTVDNYGDCYYVDNNSKCYYNQYVRLTIARNQLTGEVEYLDVQEIYEQHPSDWYYYINFEKYAKEHFNTRQIHRTGKIIGTKEYLQTIINDIVIYPLQYPEMNVMRPYWHNNYWFDKVKNVVVRYHTILQKRDMYLFSGSIIHFEEGDCDEN